MGVTVQEKSQPATRKQIDRLRAAWWANRPAVNLYLMGQAVGKSDSFMSLVFVHRRSLTIEDAQKVAEVIRKHGGKVTI